MEAAALKTAFSPGTNPHANNAALLAGESVIVPPDEIGRPEIVVIDATLHRIDLQEPTQRGDINADARLDDQLGRTTVAGDRCVKR